MDDLEHSVVIAEQDWESFYEESEECSIQPAWLASLDDSGFSDTDDEKKSTQGSDLDPVKELQYAALIHTKSGSPLEEPECLSYKTGIERFIKQTPEISGNNASFTQACLSSDRSESVDDAIFSYQQQTDLNSKGFRERNENLIDGNKLSRAIGEPGTSFPCSQDGSQVVSIKGKRDLKALESLATPKTEKERWFVTVNNSPVIQRKKSGQKKGRKKKTSRKLVRHSSVTERQGSVENNNGEKESEALKHDQILQTELMQPSRTCSEDIYFNPRPNHFCEEFVSGACRSQEVSFSPINCTLEDSSSFNTKKKNTSCVFSLKDNSDIPTGPLPNNPPAAVNPVSPSVCTDSPQLQTLNEQSMFISTPDHLTSITSTHEAYKDTQPNGSRFIMEETNASLENLQHEEHPTLSIQEPQNQGTHIESLEAAVGPSCPVYALSSFWDEMEKMTINDILHLRSVHNTPDTSRSVISDESDERLEDKELLSSKHNSAQGSGLMDDSADSDYFTYVDESKPDRSSCELSDCDEEFLQILNRNESPYSEPQHVKEPTESLMSPYIPDNEFDPDIQPGSLDIMQLSDQDGIPRYLDPAVLSFGNTVANRSISTFSETLAKAINEAIPLDRLSNTTVSFPSRQNVSVCKMYGDFFSDFEIGNVLFPLPQDKIVPIFNASRSVVRDLVFPYIEELDFDPDFRQDDIPVIDPNRLSTQPEMSASPVGMPNLCFFMSQRQNWSSLFSLRRMRFIGKGSTWCSSWILSKETQKEASYVSRAQQLAPLMGVGNKSLLLAEPQHHAVLIPKKDNFIFSINQADMCLVCIAFASWVLRSSNSQSADTWKSALLANISAISAIQYLRKYGKGNS